MNQWPSTLVGTNQGRSCRRGHADFRQFDIGLPRLFSRCSAHSSEKFVRRAILYAQKFTNEKDRCQRGGGGGKNKRRHKPRKSTHYFSALDVDRGSHCPSTIRGLVHLHRDLTGFLSDTIPTSIITATPLDSFNLSENCGRHVYIWLTKLHSTTWRGFFSLNVNSPYESIRTRLPLIRVDSRFRMQTWPHHSPFQ